MRFDHHKACRRLAEDRSLRSDHRKARKRLAEVQSARFDPSKMCKGLTAAKRVGGWHSFGESVLTTSFGECVLTTAKHVGA